MSPDFDENKIKKTGATIEDTYKRKKIIKKFKLIIFFLIDKNTIDNDNITEVVSRLSVMKAKDFKSLTNKSVFKFQDLSEQ